MKDLLRILNDAYEQAATGKGNERHGNNLPFREQPMQELIRQHGLGFATGQAAKKLQECHRLEPQAAIRELLGAIVYSAGAILALEHKVKQQPAQQPELDLGEPTEGPESDSRPQYSAVKNFWIAGSETADSEWQRHQSPKHRYWGLISANGGVTLTTSSNFNAIRNRLDWFASNTALEIGHLTVAGRHYPAGDWQTLPDNYDEYCIKEIGKSGPCWPKVFNTRREAERALVAHHASVKAGGREYPIYKGHRIQGAPSKDSVFTGNRNNHHAVWLVSDSTDRPARPARQVSSYEWALDEFIKRIKDGV